MLANYIADKKFYRKVISVTMPMILQMLLLNTFGIIDTIMVSSIYRGVAGVGIGALIENVIITIVFGINSGIGVFIAQFFGAKDSDNIKNSFALGLFMNASFVLLATMLIYIFLGPLIGLFTQDLEVYKVTFDYLAIAALSYVPVVVNFSFSLAYRNIQKAKIPLYISFISSLINVVLNYLLIFGIWIFPELGVKGAAIATVVSAAVGALVNIGYGILSNQVFIPKLRNFLSALNSKFVQRVSLRVLPLIINEVVYAVGISIYVVLINRLGSNSYEGYRIAESIANILFVVVFAVGMGTSVIIGEALGQKDLKQAEDNGRYFLFISFFISIFLGLITFFIAPFAVRLYQVSDPTIIRNATLLMQAFTIRVMTRVFTAFLFATFRAGGESRYVMFLDSGLQWLVGIPLVFLAVMILRVDNVLTVFLVMQIEQIVRIVIGLVHFSKKTWIINLTEGIKSIN